MAIVIKVRIAERTGELIRVISQFQEHGHLPKMLGKEPDTTPGSEIVTLQFKSDPNTIQSLAEELGYQVVEIVEVADGHRDSTAAVASSVNLGDLRTHYISVVGPIGGALFDETVEALGDAHDTPGGRKQLVERLAEQIDERDEVIRFWQYAGIEV